MHKLQRSRSEKPRPRDIKRQRQWEARLRTPLGGLLFPQPDPPIWKPLG